MFPIGMSLMSGFWLHPDSVFLSWIRWCFCSSFTFALDILFFWSGIFGILLSYHKIYSAYHLHSVWQRSLVKRKLVIEHYIHVTKELKGILEVLLSATESLKSGFVLDRDRDVNVVQRAVIFLARSMRIINYRMQFSLLQVLILALNNMWCYEHFFQSWCNNRILVKHHFGDDNVVIKSRITQCSEFIAVNAL